MNCPECGREMESGIMKKFPYWTQQEKPPVFRAPKDMVFLREPGDDSTGRFEEVPFHDFSGAMLCRTCKIVAFQ